jgi:hypothetical protein
MIYLFGTSPGHCSRPMLTPARSSWHRCAGGRRFSHQVRILPICRLMICFSFFEPLHCANFCRRNMLGKKKKEGYLGHFD